MKQHSLAGRGFPANAAGPGRLVTRMALSSFPQNFDGKQVKVTGLFKKEIHASESNGNGLQWKIFEMQVDEDCQGESQNILIACFSC